MVTHIEGGTRLRAFENSALRRIFWPKRGDVTWELRKLHKEELSDKYSSPNIIRVMKSVRMKWAGHAAHVGEESCIQGFGGET